METGLTEKLLWIKESLPFIVPELITGTGILLLLTLGLFIRKKENAIAFHCIAFLIFFSSFLYIILNWSYYTTPLPLFNGMIRSEDFAAYLKLLFHGAGLLSVLMTWRSQEDQKHISEYYALMTAVILGAQLLVMSVNFVMIFLSLELISICSYVLAGFSFSKQGTEGSLKYFLFGAVASAIMLYGLSIFYGLTGTLDYSSKEFFSHLVGDDSKLLLVAGLMSLAGFLYKIAAVPMHPWAPDIYEAAPMPVVAFFSVVPKLAGLGIMAKFLLALNLFGQSIYDWQLIISFIAILTLTVGNFAALSQKSPKRMMAYSSIAQSGFLLVGVAAFIPQGTHAMLFYATIYTLGNFVVFIFLQYFESKGVHTIAEFAGVGKTLVLPTILLLIALISLTGLPPTSGFTAKLFIFTSLWDAYTQTGKSVLLCLLVFGLLNTVVSLFYYLRIPFYAFLKGEGSADKANNLTSLNLLGLILVVVILILFFLPGMLMGWINKINFVL
jgi:NADH-quinone oxidoreductase subunit N